ncbi:type II toxin-antitoxin system PemK/MazF family toxin [Campylobacter sp. 19-13652]|uniref:type II toxin-antitoxin system PemK/MazF family toxin n=1 Tax=Campylobacter sp. 19-13652 TaxID=2840180 RepID=UPI001C744F74|nr:type II toxin-antitoxin system PemK/MazF family toxin [Campylobacter sp. 19-13652]BCX79248.1 hypothetical protein LBC_07100 [Campylobacter sp. 19-13652]
MSENNEFNQWNEIKKQTQKDKPKMVKLGRVYWVKVGKNIGSEIYGKKPDFRRPVLVLSKIYNNAFIGIPLSSKTNKKGFLYHIFTDKQGKAQSALLSQVRLFDTRRVIGFADISVLKSDFNTIADKLVRDIIKYPSSEAGYPSHTQSVGD